MDQGTGDSDLAAVLAYEFAVWFQRNGAQGTLPTAFSGVTKDGKQAVFFLSGFPFDHVQHRDFLIFLFRAEQFVAYAYGTHVERIDKASNVTEGVEISASSACYDVSQSLRVESLADGTFKISEDHYAVMPVTPENGIYCGLLQRPTDQISTDDQEWFRRPWKEAAPHSMWRQR